MIRFSHISTFLFVFFFCGVTSFAQKNKKAGILIDPSEFNHGNVTMWNNPPAIFLIKNISNVPITILPIFSEIDLEVIYPTEPIQPNETIELKAIYYTPGTGPFHRTFPLYVNTSNDPIRLSVKGDIQSLSPTAYIQCPSSKPELAKAKYDFFGIVYDEEEHVLSNADVQIFSLQGKDSQLLQTDPDGYFQEKLKTGNYEIHIKKEGYQSMHTTVYIHANMPAFIAHLVKDQKTHAATSSTSVDASKEETIEYTTHTNSNERSDIDQSSVEPSSNERTSSVFPSYHYDNPLSDMSSSLIMIKNHQTQHAVPYANITYYPVGDEQKKTTRKADMSGIVSLSVLPSDYIFSIVADGYAPEEIIMPYEKLRTTQTIYIHPTPKTIVFEETDEPARPITSTNIVVEHTIPSEPDTNLDVTSHTIAPHPDNSNEYEVSFHDLLSSENNTPETEEVYIASSHKHTLNIDSLKRALKKLKEEKSNASDSTSEHHDIPVHERIDISMDTHKLVDDLSLMSAELSRLEYASNNIVFLIDVSSSMGKGMKMSLLRTSMLYLVSTFRDIDRVGIIIYNQSPTVLLESISGSDKKKITQAIDSLETGGLTYGIKGIQKAYQIVEENYIPEGNNQIIVATDGLFSSVNNSMTESELNKLVKKQAIKKDIILSVIGFGNDNDGIDRMKKLAKNGQGEFLQIMNEEMAKEVLIRDIKLHSKKKIE